MAELSNTGTNYTGSYELTQQTNTKIIFATNKQYLAKNIEFGISARSASGISITGGAPSGSVNSISGGDNVTLSDTNNGIAVTASGTTSRAAINCIATTSGWVGTSIASIADSNAVDLTPKTRYITQVKIPAKKDFTVVLLQGGSSDAASGLTVTNAAYRTVTVTSAAANSKVSIITKATSGASSNTTYNVVNNGIINSVNPVFKGGAISGTATASANSSTCTISDSTNTSGISFNANASANRAEVQYNAAYNGWLSKTAGAKAYAATTSATTLTSTTYYINSVSVPADKTFAVTTRGTTNITSFISGTTPAGTIAVNAYPESGSTITDSQIIVSNGRWVSTTVSTTGTFYGKVIVNGGSMSLEGPTLDSTNGIISTSVNISTAGWFAKNSNAASGTLQLTTQNGSTIAPTESVQTAVAAGIYTLGAVKIGAISTTYVGSGITQRTSSDLSISNRTVTAPAGYYASDATYNISSITVPRAVALTVTMTANTSADNKVLTVTNNAFRTTNITNAANGTVNVTSNSGTTKVTSGSTSAGTVTIKAYNSSNTAEEKTIVSGGKWQCVPNAVNAGGTYWGRVDVPSGAASSNFTNSNLNTYLTTTGASSDSFDVSITPRHTINPAGYIAATSNANGTTSYYKIITASPTFSAAPAGGSKASSSQVTMNTTSTTSGIEIQTTYSINSATITYAAAVKGWIDKAASASTGSSTSSKGDTNGTKYYVTALQIPKTKSFPVTMVAGDANDSSKLTVTNAANRNVLIENGVNTGSKVSIKAKETSDATAVGSEQVVVENGYWKTYSVTANTSSTQTKYGKVVVGKLAVAAATVTGSATATKATINNKNTDAVSGATNISGVLGNTTTTAPSSGYFICLTANAPATTLTMTKTINTSGWLSQQSEITASASTTANNSGAKHYIGVTAAVGQVTMTAGSGTCTYSSAGNATVSDTDTSGVYLGFKGKGSVSATATITTAGYAPKTASGGSFATGASTSSNLSSELKKYITGVEIKASKTFKIKVPNGSSTVEFTWTVDANGNVVVT